MATVVPITMNGMPWEFYRDKVIDKMFQVGADSVDDSIIKLAFEPSDIKTKDIKLKSYAGLTPARRWNPNGDQLPKTAPNPRWDITWQNLWYGNSTEYTLEHKQFNLYKEVNDMSTELAVSAKQAKVVLGASTFNTGFTTLYADSKAFFAADHPLDPRVGGTYSNLVTGDLAIGTLQTAITKLETTPNDMGMPIGIKAKILWVHPNNLMNAMEVLGQGSQYRGDTTNYTVNVFNKWPLEIRSCSFFTNEKFWMLQGDKIGTVWNDVIDMQSGFKEDEGDTFLTKHWVYYCCSCGIRDPRGFVASQGT